MRIMLAWQAAQVVDVDDLGRLSATAPRTDHLWIAPDEVRRLAGPSARDPQWRKGFADMLAYAADHGWVDERGLVRVHIEDAA